MDKESINYISFGNKSKLELTKSIESLRRLKIDKQVNLITDKPIYNIQDKNRIANIDTNINQIIVSNIGYSHNHKDNDKVSSRYYKTRLNKYSTEKNIYIDSDTEVLSIDILKIYKILDNYDIVISFSKNQDKDSFWHINELEREYTYEFIGYNPLQYQCGVFGYKINDVTNRLFNIWNLEWNRYRDLDQAAFVRAVHIVNPRIYILSKAWNDSKGTIVKHNFGRTR